MRTKRGTLCGTGLLAGALRVLPVWVVLLACGSTTHAALIYGNLHAAEDAYGTDISPNGARV